MQNRYVGDVGDFGKYALIRAVAGGLKLGVVWYLTPDEARGLDGKHIRYLNLDLPVLERYHLPGYRRGAVAKNRRLFAECDPKLYDQLRGIVSDYVRDVREIRARGVLLSGTKFWEESVGQTSRSAWLAKASQAMHDGEVIFLDPDNGLSVGNKSPKHASLEEIRSFYDRGRTSLIIYHHTGRMVGGRGMNVSEQADHWTRLLSEALNLSTAQDMRTLRYHRGTSRMYFIVSAPRHRAQFETNLERFLKTRWVDSGHFSLIR